MSRSGYTDDCDNLEMWRGAVRSATNGRRGQAFFRDLVAALDAIPDKRLASEELQTQDGDVCALGALGRMRGLDMSATNTEDRDELGLTFGIAPALAAEVMYENDECAPSGDQRRWAYMRKWAADQIRAAAPPTAEEPK